MTDSLDRLQKEINTEVTEAIKVIRSNVSPGGPYLIELPEVWHVDSVKEDIEALIARTSNSFGRLSRLAGMCHALWKSHEAIYDTAWAKAFKEADGSVETRKQEATIATEAIARKVAAYEGYARIMDRYARAAELASESARKIATKVENMIRSDVRSERGHLSDEHFS